MASGGQAVRRPTSTGRLWIESIAMLVPVFAGEPQLQQAEAASFMIFTIVSSTSCTTPSSCGRMEHRQESGWLQSGQNRFAAFLVNGDGSAVETLIFWSRAFFACHKRLLPRLVQPFSISF